LLLFSISISSLTQKCLPWGWIIWGLWSPW